MPIDRVPVSAAPIGVFNAEDDFGADCGPIGPPNPDYVPGSVVINREPVEKESEIDALKNAEVSQMYIHHYAGGETSYEEDDSDDPTSGIFARLRSVARKHHSHGVA